MTAFCAEQNVELIPAPSKAFDSGGYLEPAFYLDAMHVNASYGALVLAQMRQVP